MLKGLDVQKQELNKRVAGRYLSWVVECVARVIKERGCESVLWSDRQNVDWYDLFGVQGGGKDLEKRVNWVELWIVCSSEKVGDVIVWMFEDILPDLPSASGTQL